MSRASFSTMKTLLDYLGGLSTPRYVLWCYLIWWAGVAIPYFDPDPHLWFTSAGMSLIIGVALSLSVTAGGKHTRLEFWSRARLFIMPFCVSSFAALVKGRGFFLVVHPNLKGNAWPLAACVAFGGIVLLRRRRRSKELTHVPQAEAHFAEEVEHVANFGDWADKTQT